MTTLFKHFKKQSFPISNKAELPDVVTRGANKAMEKILEEERSRGASERKRKHTSHQKLEQELPSTLLSVEMQQQ